jgi:hypothetical protein
MERPLSGSVDEEDTPTDQEGEGSLGDFAVEWT